MSISVLWAKKSKDSPYWLPLVAHLMDTAEIAKKLWRLWLSENVKRIIISSIYNIRGDEQEAIKLLVFLCAAHDIGKSTPVFQSIQSFPPTDLDADIFNNLITAGLCVKSNRIDYRAYERTPHALASQLLLENAEELGLSNTSLNKNAAIILGAHHGKPPDTGYHNIIAFDSNLGYRNNYWKSTQSELIQVILDYSGYQSLSDVPAPAMSGQVLLSGLVIMADWLSSNTELFPLIPFDWSVEIDAVARSEKGWNKLKIPGAWNPFYIRNDESLYQERFSNPDIPNNLQKAALYAANGTLKPGIMVIEAPMGYGKTEAALAVAEIFRNRTECGGVFFALPTQATSDAMFPRLIEWIEKLDLTEPQSVRLAHGKAQFNDDYTELQLFSWGDSTSIADELFDYDKDNNIIAIVHQWFIGRKKSLLANFVVGTIDQLLMMALKQKHVMLRHLGLAGKIVIIDECHAYDAYMNQYLKTALTWLGHYSVPVIVLSATLPQNTRREIIEAYMGKEKITGNWAYKQNYPLITYTDGCDIKSCIVEYNGINRSVHLEYLAFDSVTNRITDLLADGGCVGIIMNTVRRAQDMAAALRQSFDDCTVRLIHSRFITPDRLEIENDIRKVLGRGGQRLNKFIVVGTQVLEQSLDIDFDLLISDIAPMDLLLQRMGRLHRHKQKRLKRLAKPICIITGIEDDGFSQGIERVYEKHLLIRTLDLLNGLHDRISLPGDIVGLVNAAYDKDVPKTPEKENWEKRIRDKETKAKSFRMKKPQSKIDKNIEDWLNTNIDEKYGEASVRDSFDSIEVLVVKKTKEGFIMMNGTKVPVGELDTKTAKTLACQRLSLPQELSNMDVINELENSTNKYVSAWQSSPWIIGELFLILDENNSASLCGCKLLYSKNDGLKIE